MRKAMRLIAPLACAAAILGASGTAWAVDDYVALGDSYSSGTGTGSYTLDAGCERGTSAYPYLVSRARPNTNLAAFAACSGATTSDVLANQISSLNSGTDIVSITIGGNDAGFSSVLTACVTSNCTTDINNARTFITNTLPGRLDAVYAAITSAAPNARVVVLGYPRLFSTSSCGGTFGIDATERTGLNGLADLAATTIAGRAAAAGFSFVDVIPSFTGHAVCSGTAWLNGFNLFAIGESFHPNRTGHSSGYAPALRSVIG